MRPAALVAAACAVMGCGGDGTPGPADDPQPARWTCPSGWVAGAEGGCGPAVWLCLGEPMPGACDGVDLATPDADRGGFARSPDGAVIGLWSIAPPPPSADVAPTFAGASCASGWTARPDGLCDPASPACTAASGALPGGTCAPAAACPSTEYPTVGGATRLYHVRAGADPTLATGEASRPFATIAAALEVAEPSAVVLIAAGTYAETLVIDRPLRVAGVCAASVIVGGAIRVTGAHEVELSGLAVVGAPSDGLIAEEGATVTIRDARVEGVTGRAIVALGAEITAEDVLVRDVRPDAENRARGLQAAEGGRVVARRVAIEGSARHGVLAIQPGSTIRLEDSAVRDAGAAEDTTTGGVWAQDGGLIELARTVVERSTDLGIGAFGADGRISAADVVVRDSVRADQPGRGIVAQLGGRATVDRALVSGCDGYGIQAGDSGVIEVSRSLVTEATGLGVVVSGSVTSGSLTDVIVRRTRPEADGTGGRGIHVQLGATLEATRVRVEDAAEVGVYVNDGRLDLVESAIVDTRPRPDGSLGRGLEAVAGAVVNVRRARVARSRDVGVGVAYGASVVIEGSAIENVGPAGGGTTARGVQVFEATLRIERTTIEAITGVGVVAINPGTSLTLRDVRVSDVRPPFLPDGREIFGHGIEIGNGASLDAARVLVTRVAEGAIHLYGDGSAPTMARVEDVLVERTDPTDAGFGNAFLVSGRVDADLGRVAAREVSGAGMAAVLSQATAPVLRVADVYIDAVRSSTIQLDSSLQASGRSVAYGVHAGSGASISVERLTLDDGGFGLAALGGEITVRTGAIRRHVDAAATRSEGGSLVLEDVVALENAHDGVVPGDALPEGSALPAPSGVCVVEECP